MSQYENLSIISPTLNEGGNVAELIETLLKLLPGATIIIADDGSQDQTQTIVKTYSQKNSKVVLINREQEQAHGLTASVLDGIKQVNTEFFAVIDADLQHPPEVLMQLFELLKSNSIVSGARLPYQENQGFHRIAITRIATKLAQFYLRVIKGLKVSDPMSGFFAGQTQYVQNIIDESESRFEPQGYKVFFDLLKSAPKDLKYQEIQYQFRFRTQGKSKLAPRHAWYFLKSLFK